MTLFLLLVTIATVMPFAAIALEAPQLGAIGIVVGFCLAVVLGAAQFVGHHNLIAMINGQLNENVWTTLLVIIYFVAILFLGFFCAELTIFAARSVG